MVRISAPRLEGWPHCVIAGTPRSCSSPATKDTRMLKSPLLICVMLLAVVVMAGIAESLMALAPSQRRLRRS